MKFRFICLGIVFSALLFCCGCEDSALAYVPAGAQYVVYGDLEKLLEHKFWKRFSSFAPYQNFLRDNLEPLSLKEEDLAGNFVIWGSGQEMNGSENPADAFSRLQPEGMVIVLKNEAPPLMRKIRDFGRKKADVKIEERKCLGCDALVVNESLYIVQSGKKTIQIFLREPLVLCTASEKSKLAGAIDENAVFAIAFSDAVLREISGVKGDLPSVTLLQVRADEKKLSIEGSWNIENMSDPMPLLECLKR